MKLNNSDLDLLISTYKGREFSIYHIDLSSNRFDH